MVVFEQNVIHMLKDKRLELRGFDLMIFLRCFFEG